ncbi:MAG: hypothetical protein WC847_01530 [Candidatus Paceibacterota bacterium]|jgi:hypothetical protein
MIEIKDLLSRFTNLLLPEENKRETIRMAISSVIGVEISSKDIKIKNNIIYLNIKPIYKNEVFIKQEQIFLKLKETFGEKSPKDIR